VSTALAFQLWHLGDPDHKFPPLRTVESIDIGDDKGGAVQITKKRRFANFRSLMAKLDTVRAEHIPLRRANAGLQALAGTGQLEGPMNLDKVNQMYKSAEKVLNIPPTSDKGRKRRVDSIQWSTVVRGRWTKAKDTGISHQKEAPVEEETGSE